MTRAVSTAVDVAVFLLLVSAAAVTLTTVQPTRTTDAAGADDAAFVVATATATVEYEVAARGSGNRTAGANGSRTAHGTLAGLLADAAFATATVDGRELTPAGSGFERAVRAAARERLPAEGVQVVATWRPYPDAALAGRTAVGPSPPPEADVAAATLTVGVPRSASVDGNVTYRSVAAAVARAVVAGRFPPARPAPGLRGRSPAVRGRYRHVAGVLGADVSGPLRRGDGRAAQRRLVEALTARVGRDLRRRYDDPRRAADALAVGRVRVTVRRWSA